MGRNRENKTESATTGVGDRPGPGVGLALPGFLTGLIAGGAAHVVVTYWLGSKTSSPAGLAALVAIGSFASAFLLMVKRAAILKAILASGAIAILLGAASFGNFSMTGADPNLTPFPRLFWTFVGLPLTGYLLTTFAGTAFIDRTAPRYAGIFSNGLTLPIISAGAFFMTILATVALYAFSGLMRSIDIDVFHRLFQEPWFIFPFVGAVGGFAIGVMRSLQATLGGFRYVLLLFARILTPVAAVLSVVFLGALAVKGLSGFLASSLGGAAMLSLALAGMLLFNGVYQNGEGEPPPAWLRLSAIVLLLALPLYASLAAYGFWLRVDSYGLTPPRFAGLAISGIACLYGVGGVGALITELNWGGKRWMPLVPPLNLGVGALWIGLLLALATPIADPYAISARQQEQRLADGHTTAEIFDFGYLKFELGRAGGEALDRLFGLASHPQAAAIRAGVARAKAAHTRFEFYHPAENLKNDTPPTAASPDHFPSGGPYEPPGLDTVPVNPKLESTEPAESPN